MRTATVTILDASDVLQRARAILAAGPLTGTYASCGLYCPWCAIACAKSALDNEHHTTGDGPLEIARMWLWRDREMDTYVISQEQALEVLDRALELAQ